MKLHYTKDHEWVGHESQEHCVVGITQHACQELGDIVFLELPEIGKEVQKGEALAVVESVKTASDIFAPVDGTVVAVNDALVEQPERLSEDPEGRDWLVKIKVEREIEPKDDWMDAEKYQEYCTS